MTAYLTEIHAAFRIYRVRPGLATVVVLALALGIGAAGLVFNLVDAVALRPLPFEEPENLVAIWTTHPEQGIDRARVSPPDFLDWQGMAGSFERLAAYVPGDLVLTRGQAPERIPVASVTEEFFRVLGRTPVLGRSFTKDELLPGAEPTVVLSAALWQQRFGSDPNVLGQSLETADGTYTIIGVQSPGFRFPDETLAWTPAPLIDAEHFRGARFLSVLGRLSADTDPERARTEMASIAERLGEASPADRGHGIGLALLTEDLLGEVRPAMLLLLGTVGLLVLILCANVSSLLLGYGSSRMGEIGLRSALGATRTDLVRSFLVESLLLGVSGGVLGLLLVVIGQRLFLSLAPEDLPRLSQVGLDGRVIVFTLGLTLLTGLIAGLIPAIHGSGVDPKAYLASGRAATGEIGHGKGLLGSRRLLRLLAGASVAVTFALLVGAVLLLRSFHRLAGTDPGFDPRSTLTALVRLSPERFPEPAQQAEFVRSLLEALEGEVVAAGAVTTLPMSGSNMLFEFAREGGPPAEATSQIPQANYRAVAGDYFGAMGIPLLAGRKFDERDTSRSPTVVMVSRALADRYFSGEDPLDKRIRISYDQEIRRIIGVVGDVRSFGMARAPEPEMYVPMEQNPWPFATLVLRTDGDPLDLVPALRSRTTRLASTQPVDRIATLDSLVSSSIAHPRFIGLVVGLFAGVAFLSSIMSTAGLVAHSAGRRTHEIGVRMALGADRGRILMSFVEEGLATVAPGLIGGALLALALSPLLGSVLFGVAATDPWSYAAAATVLAVTAACASFFPALWASRIEPAQVLRWG